MDIVCKICNKKYASLSSRSNHTRKYHQLKDNQVGNHQGNHPGNHPKVEEKEYCCRKCNKIFTQKQNRWRHEQKCNVNIKLEENKKIDEIKELKDKNAEMEKQINELKNIVQKALKIHPKTLNKINNQLINNGIVNNNIQIVQLGHEDLTNILSEKEKLRILNRQAMSLNDLVELVHTSKKYKQFRNVYITNLSSSFGFKYDDKSKKFMAVNKNDLINDILESRMYDIENFYEDVQYLMDPIKADQVKLFIDRINDEPELQNLKKEEIKLILYNNREKIIQDIGKIDDKLNNKVENEVEDKVEDKVEKKIVKLNKQIHIDDF